MKIPSAASHWLIAISLVSWGDYAAAEGSPPNMASAKSCPKNMALAKLVAESDLIVVANPKVPVALVQSAMREESPDYIDVPLSGVSILKGADAGSTLTVIVYPKRTTNSPSPEALVEHTGKSTLLFLDRVDEEPVEVYLSDLQDASATRVEAVKAEIHRQEALVATSSPTGSLPHFNEVRDFLAALRHATPERQAEIFRQLEALGEAGVPAIVAQMDDRGLLAVRQITLANPPGHFEGLRHYGPELVVDALDAILNQITGFGGFVPNGGSERERQAAVAAWRAYAADLGCQ